MGIAVPDEARGGMALKGEWTVVKQEVVGEVGQDGEYKALNKGVRKRKVDEEEAERELAGETITRRKGWGQTYKSLPGKGGDEDDIEALFKRRKSCVKEEEAEAKTEAEEEEVVKGEAEAQPLADIYNIPSKEEAAAEEKTERDADAAAAQVKEDEAAGTTSAVVFKKRKKMAK
jgi:hypothetical protein